MEVERATYSIDDFCRAYAISRGMFYKLLKVGQAPRIMCVGTHKRISTEAAEEWRRQREAVSSEAVSERRGSVG